MCMLERLLGGLPQKVKGHNTNAVFELVNTFVG